MIIFDIIIILLVVWAAWRGYKKGVIVQLGTVLGLFLGVYLAFALGGVVGDWLNIYGKLGDVICFLVVFALVVLGIAFLGNLLSGLFKTTNMGVVNQSFGALISMAKVLLIASICVYCFGLMNSRKDWVSQQTLDKSFLYKPLNDITTFAFPYIDSARVNIIQQTEENAEKRRLGED